ncbi:putative membrane transporter protein [Candidatus Nitrotoga sp. BS]|uniref:sulfite exporter TauE/SafE family protein n=1 Tax=Candidatus Nitrotoga sp. BS TaxID=2890408 RepID=UPI001EF2CFA1|nr:sulfite exporter TauE/SafE family protein [Candidatus Nitrotoga sp. BS]CAH1194398.1 putative membrane transporter protein [Candidatus Nitrotoga sp. BS]
MIVELGLGMAVGTIMALTGAGGGIMAVPLLVFVLQLSIVQAGPIGLLAVGLAAALGAAVGLKAGIVRYRAALLMSVSGMFLTPFGVWLAHRVDNRWLSILFSIILFFIAYRTFRQALKHSTDTVGSTPAKLACVRDANSGQFVWTTRCARALAMSGGVAGFFSGLLGVGGGFVIVPALQRYTDLVVKSVVATSLTVIALVSLTGVLFSATAGALNWVVAIPFCTGALAGMMVGKIISSWLAEPQLQISFAILSAVVAVGMMVKSFA